VSKNDQVVSLFLLNPQTKPEDDTLVYNIDFKRETKPDSVSKNIKLGGKFNRKRDSGWVQTASLGLLLDITTPEGKDDQFSKYVLFGVGFEKTKADNLLFPLDGWRIKYSANLASNALLSNQDVLQANISVKRIKKLGEGRFLGRFEVGSTLVNNYDDLPQGLRYYSGGQNSVRGYKFSSLGDRVDRLIDGEIKTVNVGGRNLLNLSFEYQYPLNNEWSIATFADMGNAFADWDDYELKVGVGFGVRWKSPIGPVRIDLGFPTDSPEDNSVDNYKKPRLYLGIGSDL
jgi:translocation and assembly module TamA